MSLSLKIALDNVDIDTIIDVYAAVVQSWPRGGIGRRIGLKIRYQ
jgi:hypothetical protein